jgi:hypothetical protein
MLNKKLAVILSGLICVFSAIGQDATGTASNESGSKTTVSPKQTTASEDGRFEAGIHFTSLSAEFDGDRTGLGVRVGYKFADFKDDKFTATAEAEFNFLPGNVFTGDFRKNGRVKQGLFGLKVGRKFEKFGIFAKVRPGFINYSRGGSDNLPLPTIFSSTSGSGTISGSTFLLRNQQGKGKTNFAADVGGVIEFYPTKKIITRFDFGDTIVRLRSGTIDFPVIVGGGGTTTTTFQRFTIPAATQHNFQFSAGIGFRF